MEETFQRAENLNAGNNVFINLSLNQFQELVNTILSRGPAPSGGHGPGERFRPQELGTFDPNNDATPIVSTGDGTICHDVFCFTDRVRRKARDGPWSATNISQRLDECLRGKAQSWYAYEVSDITRDKLNASIEHWCSELEDRFRDPPGIADQKLNALRYTIADVRARKHPEDFVHSVIVRSRHTLTIESEFLQLVTAYDRLDPTLRVHLPDPTTEGMDLPRFFKMLTNVKWSWFSQYPPGNPALARR